MSAEELSAAAGIILSLLFNYIPKIREKYDLLDETGKRLVMLAVLIVVTITVFTLACLKLLEDFGLTITCDRAGAIELLRVLIVAIIANQSVYAISPQPR
jgi:hypothetical protein